MPYYSNVFREKHDLVFSINYAQALPGTPLYEYAREHGYIKKTIEAEEEYLIQISDVNAYSTDHFINYTKQPLLKVLSWRYRINWELYRYHAKHNLHISFNRAQRFKIFLIILLRVIGKWPIIGRIVLGNIKFLEILTQKSEDNKIKKAEKYLNTYYNLGINPFNKISLFFPWNRWTYPFIVIVIAWMNSNSFGGFFKLLIDHFIWSMNIFSKMLLPEISLRKIVNITDTDETVLLRKGR